jgi:hypothetical protein
MEYGFTANIPVRVTWNKSGSPTGDPLPMLKEMGINFSSQLREDFRLFRQPGSHPVPGSLLALGVYSFPSSPLCIG